MRPVHLVKARRRTSLKKCDLNKLPNEFRSPAFLVDTKIIDLGRQPAPKASSAAYSGTGSEGKGHAFSAGILSMK